PAVRKIPLCLQAGRVRHRAGDAGRCFERFGAQASPWLKAELLKVACGCQGLFCFTEDKDIDQLDLRFALTGS
ncbi:MAG: hypothetical protein J5600_04060, partial [Desulfovibrio sp.]|nr:hypothetical protein [Desulfovibrio sp.]